MRPLGLLTALIGALLLASPAGASTVPIAGYDVAATPASGFGGWAHDYTRQAINTGRAIAVFPSASIPIVDETGGNGTLNDGRVSTSVSETHLFYTGVDVVGQAVNPTVTLHLAHTVRVETIRVRGGDVAMNIFPGGLSAAVVEIEGASTRAPAIPTGPDLGGGPVDDVLDLRSTALAGIATDRVVLRGFENPFGQFSIGEIEVEGIGGNTPPTAPGSPVQAVDTGPLAVTTPLADSRLGVRVSWAAATDDGGVASYEVEQSLNGGPFARVAVTAGTTTRVPLKLGRLLPGSSPQVNRYRFRVRAVDEGANTGPYATGPAFDLLPIDDALVDEIGLPGGDRSPKVRYDGSWSQAAVAGAYNRSVRFAQEKGARARLDRVAFTVSGNVGWISTLRPDGGMADVFVDGIRRSTVDLYAPTLQAARVVYAANDLAPTETHTVVVELTGTSNPSSRGARVDVDGFVVLR